MRVGGAAVESFEPPRSGVEPPDAGLVEFDEAKPGFDPGMGVQSLAKPKVAIRIPCEGIDVLVIVGGTEPAQDDRALIGAVVAICVLE